MIDAAQRGKDKIPTENNDNVIKKSTLLKYFFFSIRKLEQIFYLYRALMRVDNDKSYRSALKLFRVCESHRVGKPLFLIFRSEH